MTGANLIDSLLPTAFIAALFAGTIRAILVRRGGLLHRVFKGLIVAGVFFVIVTAVWGVLR